MRPITAALQLRAMNIIYETTKERGATILIPSAMIDSMNPGGVLALAGLGNQPDSRTAPTPKAAKPVARPAVPMTKSQPRRRRPTDA